ncbi:hypothetical protein RHMOL_RhmolUnG0011000 [Rhododendron molle]|nr:hypothetical protein RHMOL_RhmolUnG0011000 [Rhododendron molle]
MGKHLCQGDALHKALGIACDARQKQFAALAKALQVGSLGNAKDRQKQLAALAKAWQAGSPGKAKGGQKQLAALAKAWQAGSPGKAKGGQKQLAALAKAWQAGSPGKAKGGQKQLAALAKAWQAGSPGKAKGGQKQLAALAKAWQAGSPGKAKDVTGAALHGVIQGVYCLGRKVRVILKFHRDGDRSLQLLVFNEEFLVSASHQLALTTSLPFVHTASSSYLLNGQLKGYDRGDVGFWLPATSREVTEPYHLEEGEVVTRFP